MTHPFSPQCENMTKGQLLTCHVRDPDVLRAMAEIPREHYVPEAFRAAAYVDEEIPLAPERWLMEPLVFARLLELARITPEDRVLDIGCGYGYSTAVLARLARKVVAVEPHPELVGEARRRLDRTLHAEVVTAPLAAGCPRQQPFEVIVLEGAVRRIPDALLAQLAEGGRLVAVENLVLRPGAQTGLGRALRVTRRGGRYERFCDFDAAVPLLPGFEEKNAFFFS